jgi:hypothetical protein
MPHSRSIIKFAGDAILVLWRNARRPAEDEPVQPLRMLVMRAVLCNLALIHRHNRFLPPGLDESAGIRLQLHTGIGAVRTWRWQPGGARVTRLARRVGARPRAVCRRRQLHVGVLYRR